MNRAALCLTGTALALSLAALPALAQNNGGRGNRASRRAAAMQSSANYTNWNGDQTLPVADATQEAQAIQTLTDRGFGRAEIESVLPLLHDLQTAENMYYDTTYMAAFMALGNNSGNTNTPDAYQGARQMFRDKHDAIWSTIRQKVGDDRANALQALIEPVPMSTTDITYSSAHLTRIDQLLAQWDQEAAARMAANGGTPTTTTTTTVSVETAPTAAAVPVTIYSFPPLTTTQLVDLLQNRLAVLVGTPEAAMALHTNGRLTSPEMQFLEQRKLGTWTWGSW